MKEEKGMEVGTKGGSLKGLGSSIPVENVQALATADPDKLTVNNLHRCIRPEIKGDIIGGDDSRDLPVIDLCRLLDPQFKEEEASNLKYACEEWGFFQLVNHGISVEVIEEMKADIQEFFRLPLEEKEALAQPPGDLEGYGQAFVVSDDQKLDWGDMLFLVTQPPQFRNSKLWPTDPSTFRNTLSTYSSEVHRVAHCLLGLMAENLGADPGKLVDMFKHYQSVRINYYPPCPHSDKVLGLSPHSDSVGLTVLLQVNEVQGLQIKQGGRWVPIKPLPGAFIVNIGDIIEILSNGKYKSVEHRAIINTEKERLSIAAFHTLNFGSWLGPLPELTKGSKEYYKTLSIEDFGKFVFSSKLDGKQVLDQLKLTH